MWLPLRKKQQPRLRLKIGVLVLACFLWLYVALTGTFTDDIECRIVPVNLNPGKTLASPLRETITVNITGSGIDLLWLHLFWKSDLKFNLDLSTISRYYELPVKDYLSWITVPRGFEDVIAVNNIVYPDNITVELDDLDSLLVPVRENNLLITVEEGYVKIGKTYFQPDSVLVTGPRSIVAGMHEILTEIQSFENKSKNFSETIALEKLQSSVISYSYDEVKMTADIQKIVSREITNVPIMILQKPPRYSVEFKPSSLTIDISGGVDYIKDLSADDFMPSVTFDRSWVRGGEYFAPVAMEPPEQIIEYSISPNNITITIK